MQSILPAAAALAAAVISLPAQSSIVLPSHANLVDGHHAVSLPFGQSGFRTQLLIDLSANAPTTALVTGLRFRAERAAAPTPSVVVPNVTVQVSSSSIVPGSLDTTFASNVTGPTTVVFQGSVTLPAQQAGFAGPSAWDIVIPFSQPFVLLQPANLLIDIVGDNAPNAQPEYFLDAVQGGGSATPLGVGGDDPTADTLRLQVETGNSLEPRFLTIGHTINWTTTRFFTPLPGFVALGTLPLPLPIDLAPVGAPTNTLYIDPIVLSTHVWTPSFIGFFSTLSIAVPNLPTLIDATIYAQSFGFDAAANPLGLIASAAMETRIGDPSEVLPMQQLDAADPQATAGVLLNYAFVGPPDFGATPIQLEGLFF